MKFIKSIEGKDLTGRERLDLISEFSDRWEENQLPEGIERNIHQNRLIKLAREGNHMTVNDLSKFEEARRFNDIIIQRRLEVYDKIVPFLS